MPFRPSGPGLCWTCALALGGLFGTAVHAQEYFFVDLSGSPNTIVDGFVPHGDPLLSGFAELTIFPNNTMEYNIVLENDRYRVTQAHLYNINKTSGTSGNPAYGDSIICWGGRWASGGDSDDFLLGTGYSNGRLGEVLADPTGWFLMLHTEGGHFALDTDGELVIYDPNRSGIQETSVTGVPEAERSNRFNNRVGKRLTDTVLRVDNSRDPAAPFHDPTASSNQNPTPFPDTVGNRWVESDGLGGWQLTPAAITRGYDLNTEYLFYLYDDQGPLWDFGGPEGAAGGFLGESLIFNGDLNFDDAVDLDDWQQLLSGYATDLTGLTTIEAYMNGDVDRDGRHSLLDIDAFRDFFAAAGGDVGLLVPEPSGMITVAFFGCLCVGYCRRHFAIQSL